MSHHWYESDWERHKFNEKVRKIKLEEANMQIVKGEEVPNPNPYRSRTEIEAKDAEQQEIIMENSGKSFKCVAKKETWEGLLPSGDKLIATRTLSGQGKEVIDLTLLPISSEKEFNLVIKAEDFQQFQNNLMAFYF